ncbi:MAG: SIR2 family protein, partial [Candidatus Staskawiczbacteria bacterium]|nr:SIR2 family protein [Candidatus Staskawiczbacteria bacterium]
SPEYRSNLVPRLFENPCIQQGEYILQKEINTLDKLEKEIRQVANNDLSISIKSIFEVYDDFDMPRELLEKLLGSEKIVFFIGAGVSRLCGIPLWDELADNAIKFLREKNYLNYFEAKKLSEQYLPKQKISIFHKLISAAQRQEFYEKQLKPKPLNSEQHENKIDNPYELLSEFELALAKPIIKITTNIDNEWMATLEKRCKTSLEPKHNESNSKKIKTQDSGFNGNQKIETNVLYQLHGSLKNLDKTVFTTFEYINAYKNGGSQRNFLEKVFLEHTVLFIGNGLSEFEILEHCLPKDVQKKHFALVDTYIGEKNLFRVKKEYFSEIGIHAIPYYLDFQEYNRLTMVLNEWTKTIKSKKSVPFYNNIELIDEVL